MRKIKNLILSLICLAVYPNNSFATEDSNPCYLFNIPENDAVNDLYRAFHLSIAEDIASNHPELNNPKTTFELLEDLRATLMRSTDSKVEEISRRIISGVAAKVIPKINKQPLQLGSIFWMAKYSRKTSIDKKTTQAIVEVLKNLDTSKKKPLIYMVGVLSLHQEAFLPFAYGNLYSEPDEAIRTGYALAAANTGHWSPEIKQIILSLKNYKSILQLSGDKDPDIIAMIGLYGKMYFKNKLSIPAPDREAVYNNILNIVAEAKILGSPKVRELINKAEELWDEE